MQSSVMRDAAKYQFFSILDVFLCNVDLFLEIEM